MQHNGGSYANSYTTDDSAWPNYTTGVPALLHGRERNNDPNNAQFPPFLDTQDNFTVYSGSVGHRTHFHPQNPDMVCSLFSSELHDFIDHFNNDQGSLQGNLDDGYLPSGVTEEDLRIATLHNIRNLMVEVDERVIDELSDVDEELSDVDEPPDNQDSYQDQDQDLPQPDDDVGARSEWQSDLNESQVDVHYQSREPHQYSTHQEQYSYSHQPHHYNHSHSQSQSHQSQPDNRAHQAQHQHIQHPNPAESHQSHQFHYQDHSSLHQSYPSHEQHHERRQSSHDHSQSHQSHEQHRERQQFDQFDHLERQDDNFQDDYERRPQRRRRHQHQAQHDAAWNSDERDEHISLPQDHEHQQDERQQGGALPQVNYAEQQQHYDALSRTMRENADVTIFEGFANGIARDPTSPLSLPPYQLPEARADLLNNIRAQSLAQVCKNTHRYRCPILIHHYFFLI